MNIVVWVLRGVLAVVFVGHGAAFIKQPPPVKAQLADGPLSLSQFRVLGVLEVLGGIAVVALPALDVLPALDLVALICIGIVLVGAAVVHLRRSEPPGVVMTVALLAATTAITIAR
jgi:uncharacterized membrane protein YphA (DoxX/SURF4 family)